MDQSLTNRTGGVIELLGLAALFGAMLFFGAVMAPLVFVKLPPETAGAFIRSAFPWYYAFMLATSLLAALGAALRRATIAAGLLVVIAAVTAALWFVLIPHLDALRLAGNTAAFNRGHHFSVLVDGAQLLVVLALLVRSALR
jgi:Domain of unknown function (DUF4149)